MAGARAVRSDRPGGVLPREGWLHPGGQEGLPDLRRTPGLPGVRPGERRALRHLGRALRARAPQAEEAGRLTLAIASLPGTGARLGGGTLRARSRGARPRPARRGSPRAARPRRSAPAPRGRHGSPRGARSAAGTAPAAAASSTVAGTSEASGTRGATQVRGSTGMSSTASSTGAELLGPARLHVAHHVERRPGRSARAGAVRRHPAGRRARAERRSAHAAAAPVADRSRVGRAPSTTASLRRARASWRRSVRRVGLLRRCSRTACGRPATTTLTYVYADQTAVVGPLATYAEPHAYDLCDAHSERLSAPRGWEVLRLARRRRARARPPTTCWPWPTPSARPPSRARSSGRRSRSLRRGRPPRPPALRSAPRTD